MAYLAAHGATAVEGKSSNHPPAPTIPSRSASLIVSSRSRAQATRSPRQPITFAIPPSAPSPTTSPSASPKGKPSLLRKLGRSLSQSRTQLVRRVSGSRSSTGSPPSTAPTTPPILQVTAPELLARKDSGKGKAPELSVPTGGPARLTRGLRVLGRSKSEGRRRVGVAKEEERMDELVRRAERSCGASRVGTDAHSGMGSYFWSDSLGVCWDGREQVLPDLLSVQPAYSSNADYLPVPFRVVYASTLSTFPPRPPLRRLSTPPPPPTLSPAEEIIAEYRAAHGAPPSPLDPIISSDATPIPTPKVAEFDDGSRGPPLAYARSVASDSSSSRAPSELRFTTGGGGRASEDSSTSLESMRDVSPPGQRIKMALDQSALLERSPPAPSPLAISSLPRFNLVDEGPVRRPEEIVGKSQWATFGRYEDETCSETSSVEEDWRDCE